MRRHLINVHKLSRTEIVEQIKRATANVKTSSQAAAQINLQAHETEDCQMNERNFMTPLPARFSPQNNPLDSIKPKNVRLEITPRFEEEQAQQ